MVVIGWPCVYFFHYSVQQLDKQDVKLNAMVCVCVGANWHMGARTIIAPLTLFSKAFILTHQPPTIPHNMLKATPHTKRPPIKRIDCRAAPFRTIYVPMIDVWVQCCINTFQTNFVAEVWGRTFFSRITGLMNLV